ncbi:MAG: hypothetical protein LC102_11130 [Ignavibacteriales bacterium]|jgi:hypothetical protein|nr:MAG: hypothetical protein F9K26_05910 [Ignavibacteriaceae bacterium]MBW7873743.1 hypothetical protein [Ignavibacteria bacterium]MBZ0195919.1 hypothetical protein [Ignavibacteriaceae bacterium]MCZ2143968.1 hypothetical protein [Ignavibacteriales bacterium]WKZ71906.1 MAG: hypothetical protein QY308_09780 [Ignavibacteriaceae bacterium]
MANDESNQNSNSTSEDIPKKGATTKNGNGKEKFSIESIAIMVKLRAKGFGGVEGIDYTFRKNIEDETEDKDTKKKK